MFGLVRFYRFLRADDREVVLECRRCGTSVESRTISCPHCGHDGIATYEIS